MRDRSLSEKTVLCVGINNLDVVIRLDLPEVGPDRKLLLLSPLQLVGGQCVNAATTMARLGLSVSYVGVTGEDANAGLIRAHLKAEGIDDSACQHAIGMPNTSAFILVDRTSGERCILVTVPENYPGHSGEVPDTIWQSCGYVYFDGNELDAALLIAKEAKLRGIASLADVEILNAQSLQLLKTVDTAIVPRHVGEELAGTSKHTDMLDALHRLGLRRGAVTLGPTGVVGFDEHNTEHFIPGERITAVDTTGAGDAFHAGFLFADMQGADFEEALRFASKTAAQKCLVPGPSLSREALQETARGFNASLQEH